MELLGFKNLLLPPSLEELIDPNHPVCIVTQVVDNLNLDPILAKYEGGGCPAYHPRLMLKVLVYGYVTNTYSSRKIEQVAREELEHNEPVSFEEINVEKVTQTIIR